MKTHKKRQAERVYIAFYLTPEEMGLIRRLMKIEQRDGAHSENLYARELVRQYLHEFRVMERAWPRPKR